MVYTIKYSGVPPYKRIREIFTCEIQNPRKFCILEIVKRKLQNRIIFVYTYHDLLKTPQQNFPLLFLIENNYCVYQNKQTKQLPQGVPFP